MPGFEGSTARSGGRVTLRVGVAGLGSHAQRRILPALARCPDIEVAAVWTRDAGKLDVLRKQSNAALFTDFARFLDSGIDVVYVATPTGLHYRQALAALERGRHVWCEKPLATTLDEVRTLVESARQRGLALREGYMFVHHQQAARLAALLQRRAVGRLRAVDMRFCFPHLPPDNFRYDSALGGGAFLDHACYLVKALDHYVGGAWSFLGGCMDNAGHAVDVSGTALLRGGEDVLAHLSWGFGYCYVNEMQILGDTGRLVVQMPFTKPPGRSCDILVHDSQGGMAVEAVAEEDPYLRMLQAYAEDMARPSEWPRRREEVLRQGELLFGLMRELKEAGKKGMERAIALSPSPPLF